MLDNEFKSLEIDIDKGIYKLNDTDLTKCQRIEITIEPQKADVCVVTTGDTIYRTLKIKRWLHSSNSHHKGLRFENVEERQ